MSEKCHAERSEASLANSFLGDILQRFFVALLRMTDVLLSKTDVE